MKQFAKLLLILIAISIQIIGCKKADNGISSNNGGGGSGNEDVRVTTYTPQDITAISAVCGGDVIVTPGMTLTNLGVCWNTEGNPLPSENYISTDVWNAPFVCTITGLVGNTTYHIRAYALDGIQCYFGEEKVFTTEQMWDELYYNDDNPIHLALREDHKIADSSAYPITYTSSDDTYVRVSDNGVLTGAR